MTEPTKSAETRGDIIKFLTMLVTDCAHADHKWNKCARCLAFHELEYGESFGHSLLVKAIEALTSDAQAFADGQARGRAEWPEWQPIETAPMDGTEILLGWFDLGSAYRVRHLGYWNDLHNRWADGSGRRWRVPTHWMPLPGNPDSAALRARDRTCKVCGGGGFIAQKQCIDDGYGEVENCPACGDRPQEDR